MKYAVITGATKGIGKAIAEKFLKKGYFVFVNYASDENAAQEFSIDNEKFKDRFLLLREQLNSYESVQKLISHITKATQTVDCLILNAGVTDRSPFSEISHSSWETVLNVNLNTPFYLVQGLSPYLVDQTGRIIFIGSIMGMYPHASSLSYSVTKAAVHQLAKSLVKEFAPRSITVNAVAPGFIETPWQKEKPQEIRNNICLKTALNRFGKPEEVAELCWHIVENGFINGSVLKIDGGYSFR